MVHFYSRQAPHPAGLGNRLDVSAPHEMEHRTTYDALQAIIAAQEQELSRIARELHDDVCQRLAMLSYRIDKISGAWSSGQTQIGEQLEVIQRQCSVLTSDVQAISHKLHPSILENLGLVSALRNLCAEVMEQGDVVVDFMNTDVLEPLPPDVSLSLFRVVQEALYNSVKHSGDDHYQVELRGCTGGIYLEVSDWGVGFDVARVENGGRGLGLVSMRERIGLLGGTIKLESSPNTGTRIHIWVPLTAKAPVASASAH